MSTTSVPLPSRESLVAVQVNTILSLVTTLSSALYHGTASETEGGKLDGGTKAATEATLINAYTRLDSILANEACWSMAGYGELEKKCAAVYDSHLDLMALQKRAVGAMQAPHRTYPPTLLKLDDGRWTALLGDIRSPSAIVGIGQSPAEAIEDFDKIFEGRQQNASVVVETEPTNEKHLDPRTDKPASNPPQRRKNKRRGGANNGKD